jgi:hypothetical protein
MSDDIVDKYLDRIRDEFHYSVYKCPVCGFRAFGAPVFYHELTNKSHGMMIREIPNANQVTI